MVFDFLFLTYFTYLIISSSILLQVGCFLKVLILIQILM